jgi:hypothetical protein
MLLLDETGLHQVGEASAHRGPVRGVQSKTKLACAALMALTLASGAAYAPVQQLAGDPSQWGVEDVYKKGSFDLAWSRGSEEPLASTGTSKGGDTPVVTG